MRPACALLVAALIVGCTTGRRGDVPSVAHSGVRPGEDNENTHLQAHTVDGLERVAVVNDVASCITLTPQRLLLVGSVEIGIYSLERSKSIGACGCMSSTLEYRVTQKQEEPPGPLPPGVPPLAPYQRVLGSVDLTPDTHSVSLVVSPDRSLYGSESLTLTPGCQGAE